MYDSQPVAQVSLVGQKDLIRKRWIMAKLYVLKNMVNDSVRF